MSPIMQIMAVLVNLAQDYTMFSLYIEKVVSYYIGSDAETPYLNIYDREEIENECKGWDSDSYKSLVYRILGIMSENWALQNAFKPLLDYLMPKAWPTTPGVKVEKQFVALPVPTHAVVMVALGHATHSWVSNYDDQVTVQSGNFAAIKLYREMYDYLSPGLKESKELIEQAAKLAIMCGVENKTTYLY